MGTRCLTRVFDESGEAEIVCMYRQFDGYPDGHGQELADFLKPIVITNGKQGVGTANGFGCLAAQIVAHFKDEPGGIYLHPTGTVDAGQDYEYHVKPDQPWDGGSKMPAIAIAVYEFSHKGKLKLLAQCKPSEFEDLLTTVQALQD